MKNASPFLNFLERTIRNIWQYEKIQRRTKTMCFIVPFLLTLVLLTAHLIFFTACKDVPYVCLFSIVLISAGYGGGRGALFGSCFTFAAIIVYWFLHVHTDVATLFLYVISTLFLTALLHFFLQNQQTQQALLVTSNRANEELIRIEKNHEDFINMAAHELKSPVTVLKAYIQLVCLKMEKQKHYDYPPVMDKMDLQVDKLLNLINDLQDAAKINSESLSMMVSDFSINESIKNCADAVLATNPEAVIEYELTDTDPVIKADRERIEQVISNFIENGLKYSDGKKRIKINSSFHGETVRIAVIDSGLGIPAEKQTQVFERFFRVSSAEVERLPGLGLGLFICREIIKQHRGEIGLISEEGKGSEFWFSLKA